MGQSRAHGRVQEGWMKNTKRTKGEVVESIEGTFGVVSVASKRLGVTRTTFYRYIERFRLADMLREERDKLVDMAEAKIAKLVSDGDFRAVQMVLERMGRDRGWGIQQEVSLAQAVSVRPVIRFDTLPRDGGGDGGSEGK